MRTREALLFVLLLAIVFAFRSEVPAFALAPATMPALPPSSASGQWHYDARSPYYSYLPSRVRQMRSPHPQQLADEVCEAMGGRLDFTEQLRPAAETLGFNCRFHEPDLTISTEFGDLRRMPARVE